MTHFLSAYRDAGDLQVGCRPMPIVFLDFDGVHIRSDCHESKHFSCLPVFESVLSQVPDCKLVIASTWGCKFQ